MDLSPVFSVMHFSAMRSFTDTALHAALPVAVPVAVPVAGLLLGLWTLGPAGAAAQVQIDQVRQATGQVEGASQAEVLVATGEDVSEGEVLDLIQDVAPPVAPDGNSAAVFQRGDGNDATIRQAGIGNQAVAKQLGSDNAIAITQDGGALPSAFEGDLPDAGAAFKALRRLRPVGRGTGNLAVAVHEGSGNRTGIVQRGTDNRAGIRLVGSGNTTVLLQAGDENQFLMDATVSNWAMSVVQNGDGNVLDTTRPVNAEMNGNGVELVIRQGAFGPLSLE